MVGQFVFDCPACDVVTDVDADVRDALLSEGCVICASAVGPDAFSRPDRDDSS